MVRLESVIRHQFRYRYATTLIIGKPLKNVSNLTITHRMIAHVNDPNRILIIRPSALGDVCRSVPILTSLRGAFPNASIDWLVQDSFADAVRNHPDLNEAIPFPRREFGRQAKRFNFRPAVRWLKSMREREYDVVFDCQGLLRSGVISRATRAPRRVADSNAREFSWLGANERHAVPKTLHTVDRMLSLLERSGIEPVCDMTLHAPHEDRERVASDPELAGKRIAVVAPTSRWAAKRWPVDRFAQVVRELGTMMDAVVIVGAPDERDQCRELTEMASKSNVIIDRVGSTGVGSLMAIIEAAQIVIANDSAALHMAVGFDRPIVALFGPTRVEHVGPYEHDDDVLQHVEPSDKFEHKNDSEVAMMHRIEVDEVLEAVRSRLP